MEGNRELGLTFPFSFIRIIVTNHPHCTRFCSTLCPSVDIEKLGYARIEPEEWKTARGQKLEGATSMYFPSCYPDVLCYRVPCVSIFDSTNWKSTADQSSGIQIDLSWKCEDFLLFFRRLSPQLLFYFLVHTSFAVSVCRRFKNPLLERHDRGSSWKSRTVVERRDDGTVDRRI